MLLVCFFLGNSYIFAALVDLKLTKTIYEI
jgi:hypothetical protein